MVSETWDGEARLLHVVAARQLGQEGRGRRAVPEGLRLGREDADAALRGRLHEGEARPAAPHALRPGRSSTRTRSTGGETPRTVARAERRAARRGDPRPRRSPRLRGVRRPARADLDVHLRRRRLRPGLRRRRRPGTYALPAIATSPTIPLLDADGHATTLFALNGDRLAVVAFVYTSCAEARGCPVSTAPCCRRSIARSPPIRRSPAASRSSPSASIPSATRPRAWRQLRDAASRRGPTGASSPRADEAELHAAARRLRSAGRQAPLEDGAWTGLFRHVLKVFLLDGANRMRNVYSTGFLDAALVLTDLRTLLLEKRSR